MTGSESGEPDAFGERVASVSGDRVKIDRSSVHTIDAASVDVHRSAVRSLHAEEATVTDAAVASATLERGTLRQSMAGLVFGRSLALDQVNALVVASPVVRGEVRTLIDLRSFVALGVGIAFGRALVSLVRWGVRSITR